MTDKAKKKVAFLGIKGLPSKGGAERVVEGIVNNLAGDFDIYVYCSKSYSKDYHPDHIHLIKLRHLKGKHLYSFSLSLFSALHALFARKFDLIHVHNTDSGFIVPLLRLKYKVIGTSHGFAYQREKWSGYARFFLKISERILFSFANTITCVSKSITRELTASYKKEVLFIPNGIDKPEYREDTELFERHRLREKDYICFAAGRVDPTKGLHILLKAFSGIERDIRLVAIGDFSHKKDYSEQMFALADDRVEFIPFIAEKEALFGIIRKAVLFVFPSTVEAMSIMLMEVSALGVPVVCSDIPENTTVLEDKTTYFKSGDDADLKAKIELCLARHDMKAAEAQKTKEWVTDIYNWKNIAKKYKNLYNNFTN
jgi:glycosyltransferase involved in cell wall biosynthesis